MSIDCIDLTQSVKESLLLFFAGVEKAFDHVDWQFMKLVLKGMKFGEGFLIWVYMIYKEQAAIISKDGNSSEKKAIRKGVRQGCPLLPILFDLIIEVVADIVQKDEILYI